MLVLTFHCSAKDSSHGGPNVNGERWEVGTPLWQERRSPPSYAAEVDHMTLPQLVRRSRACYSSSRLLTSVEEEVSDNPPSSLAPLHVGRSLNPSTTEIACLRCS